MKNTITEILKTLEGINNTLSDKEEWISELKEWKSLKLSRKKKKGMKRNDDSSRDLWNNIKDTAICIIGVEQRHKGAENIFENIIAENFHNLGKGRDNQLQKAQSLKQDQPKEDHTKAHCN